MSETAATPVRKSCARVITRDKFDGENGNVLKAMAEYATRQLEDPFKDTYISGTGPGSGFGIIAPPYSLYELTRLPTLSNSLGQCIAAMATNIEGFGFTLEYVGPEGKMDSAEAKAEKQRVTDLFDQPNGEYDFTTLRKRMRTDFETVGNSYMECGRDNDGNVAFLYHVPANSIRVTKREPNPIEVTVWLNRGGKLTEVKVMKRYRRFVQLVGAKRIYFKEFGDPRVISSETGEVKDGIEPDKQATEILWLSRYVTGETYGLPRYINNLPAILGSRESEMTNLRFFEDNAIPAMAVLVSGGYLTEESVAAIEGAFNIRGKDAMNRVLVLEAQSSTDGSVVEGQTPTPKMELKPLTADRQGDSLFQVYDENNQSKVRSSFRLPPILVGRSDDYTRATAEAALETAEQQVFGPERAEVDNAINQKVLLFKGKPLVFWKFRSNPARLVANEVKLNSIEKLDKAGAMTPNIAIELANEMFDRHIEKIKEPWGDMPFAFVTALIAAGKIKPKGIPTPDDLAEELSKGGSMEEPPAPAEPAKPGAKGGKAKGKKPATPEA